MTCDEHSTYKFSSKCPATCENKNPTDEDCDLPAVEGCVCDEGYYLDDKKCVLESQCGCIADDNEYYKVVIFLFDNASVYFLLKRIIYMRIHWYVCMCIIYYHISITSLIHLDHTYYSSEIGSVYSIYAFLPFEKSKRLSVFIFAPNQKRIDANLHEPIIFTLFNSNFFSQLSYICQ